MIKKIVAAISVIVIIAIMAVSCTSQKCAAYGGERSRYQVGR